MSGKRKPSLTLSPQESGDEEGRKDPATDYDDVASPSSSTASGPVYVRTPGFSHHAHSVLVNSSGSFKAKGKKKKGLITPDAKEVLRKGDVKPTTKARLKKEPLPMKLRALPQSFWQQPNVANDVSPAALSPVLPPLFNKEPPDDVTEVRPVTPPEERDRRTTASENINTRMVSVANPELLFRLFDRLDSNARQVAVVKRGRPKKQISSFTSRSLRSEDPCMVSLVTETLLPLLPNSDRSNGQASGMNRPPLHQTLTMIPVRDGDKCVSLPSLNVDHNYAQLLSELVVKL